MTADDASWQWWLRTAWQPHRHTVEQVHPLLVELQQARGASFMTAEHIVAVLDAKDPGALVRSWIAGSPLRRERLGLPARICAWREGDEPCPRPVRAVNARFCETHAGSARKEKTRARVARSRAHREAARMGVAGGDGEEPVDGSPPDREDHRGTSAQGRARADKGRVLDGLRGMGH